MVKMLFDSHAHYDDDSFDALYKYFANNAIAPNPKLLEKAGLITAKKDDRGYYDKFRNRVIFPIFDVQGNVIAFGGRVMDDSIPKYLNSPETPAYSKGNNLYALNVAKKSQSERVIIVEGYMDCIALHKAGINWAVASLGTALTPAQARLLKKYFNEVIIGYDADSAAKIGVYIHGLAGDEAANQMGQIAMTASDIISYLPQAWKTIFGK